MSFGQIQFPCGNITLKFLAVLGMYHIIFKSTGQPCLNTVRLLIYHSKHHFFKYNFLNYVFGSS